MMIDQPAPQFSETDVQSLGQKLAAFSQTLTPGEWSILTGILQRAMPGGGDVQGFSYDLHTDPINRKLLVVGYLQILNPDDVGPDEPCSFILSIRPHPVGFLIHMENTLF